MSRACCGRAGAVTYTPFCDNHPGTGDAEETTRAALVELDGPDIDAILQVGTDLVMARVADEAERWLGKPVLAANPTMLWHALRTKGIPDQIKGFGTLLREH